MRTSTKNLTSAALTVLLSTALTLGMAAAPQQANKPLPAGDWSLTIRPYTGAGWDAIPLDVVAVTTEATRGLMAEQVRLENRSSKKVIALKLRWYLRLRQQDSVLLQGETEAIHTEIKSGERLNLNYPVVAFANVYQPLMKGGALTGNYAIEVVAGSVTYEDGTSWQISGDKPTWPVEKAVPAAAPKGAFVKTGGALLPPKPQAGCQNQECTYSGGCYRCNEQLNSCCRVNSCTSCTIARCQEKIGCSFDK